MEGDMEGDENIDDVNDDEIGEESENEEEMDEFEAKLLGLAKTSNSNKIISKPDPSSVVTSLKPKTKNLPTKDKDDSNEFDELDELGEDGELDNLSNLSEDDNLDDIMQEDLGSDVEFDEEDKPKTKKDIKEKKEKKPKAKKGELLPAPANLKFRDETLAAGDRRAPGYAISKNRGLMPYRKHGSSNSRVVLKNKYEKAKKKLNSTHKTYKGKEDNYGGERNGIKTNLAKSIRLT